jgi:hypothetical protein
MLWTIAHNNEYRKWTPEEDAILAKAIAMYGERNWQQGK